MGLADLRSILPILVAGGAPVAVMLLLAVRRSHAATTVLTLAALAAAMAMIPIAAGSAPRQVTPLLVVDGYALFYMGLVFAAGFAVVLLSYDYLERLSERREEFSVLILLATAGAAVLAASSHFASFFLGLEILSVSLYALIAYERHDPLGIEAGIKYLVLAAAAAAFLLFGMALIYAETGTMAFDRLASMRPTSGGAGLMLTAGLVMMLVGFGFKLAWVPFHLWTADVYEGAPTPVAGYVATVSKGAVFALLLRYFSRFDVPSHPALMLVFTVIAVASMFVGNLLALKQRNVKRVLAYSSIAHLGYLLVAFLAGGTLAPVAVTFYLVAYFVTMLGAFGVVTILSRGEREADVLDRYRGLAWRRPWLTAAFTLMLLSLAGIPVTAGFVAKFYALLAGVGSGLWLLVGALVINSAIGLYYYLRVVITMYRRPPASETAEAVCQCSLCERLVITVLSLLVVWFGVYPTTLVRWIQEIAGLLSRP